MSTAELVKRKVNMLTQSNNKDEIIALLQEINHILLKSSISVSFKNNKNIIILEPKWIEAYYCTLDETFKDENSHQNFGQMNNPGEFYFHKKGYGGVDICFSYGKYYLSFLIKLAQVTYNETIETKTQTKIRKVFRELNVEESDCIIEIEELLDNDMIYFDTIRKNLSKSGMFFINAELASFKNNSKGIPTSYFLNGKERFFKEYFKKHLSNCSMGEKEELCKKYLGYRSTFVIGE